MSIRLVRMCLSLAWMFVGCCLWPEAAAGQTPASTQDVELAPIACYWRTSVDAVRVGEPFTLTLTCGVLDTVATTVVPDQSRLDPGVLQLQPFETRGGTQAPDIRTANRRYFQYEYQLRYVGEEVGRDLSLPALTMTYRVQSRVQQDSAAVESRERQYILPAHMIRILSAVPSAARDIRDVAPVTLAQIEAQRFRASLLRITSYVCYGLGAVVAIWGLVRITEQRRSTRKSGVRHARVATILGGIARELQDVRRDAQASGWTPDLAARALAAARVAASYDSGIVVPQAVATSTQTLLRGQVRLPARWPQRSALIVSGATTSILLARFRQQYGHTLSTSRRARLDVLESALAQLTQAAYGRGDAPVDASALDEALAATEKAVSGIAREHSWLALALRRLRHGVAEQTRVRGWARS